jgi:hypothetical protein
MRKFATLSTMLVALVAIAPAQDSIHWRKDFDAGIKEAKTSGKLAMIDFYAEW